MQLLAVLAPPPDVVAEALALAHAACEPPVAEAEPVRGLRRWVRRAPAEPAPAAVFTALDHDAVVVRVARLGNVGGEQVAGLAAAVGPAAARWPDPLVHLAGLELDDAGQVVGVLDGEVDALAGIFRGLESTVRPHGFFLDRRAFRSQLGLGTLAVPDGAAVPDGLGSASTSAVRGADWRPGHLDLVRRAHRGGAESFEVLESFELGTG